MRDITQDMKDQLESSSVQAHLLADFYFDSGFIGMWTGYGNLTWNGNDYSGGGNFINVSSIDETQELQAKNLVCSLNGIPSNLLATALSENIKNRSMRLYLATVDTTRRIALEDDSGVVLTEDGDYVLLENNLVDSPYPIFSGLMDVVEFTDNGDTADIRLSVENILFKGQRAKTSRYTHEEQIRRFPDDMGLEFINRLQDREIVW